MGIDQVVVMGVLIVVLMALFVMTFDFMLPMLTKLQYDAICRKYVLIAEASNGLSEHEVNALKNELTQLGMKEIDVTCGGPNQVKRGEKNEFKVEADYAASWFISLFRREEKIQKMVFQQSFLSRKIVM